MAELEPASRGDTLAGLSASLGQVEMIRTWLRELRSRHPDLYTLTENVRMPLSHLETALRRKQGSHPAHETKNRQERND